MNKKEAIERIQELVATEEINECLEILRQPPTLAEILGWEEDVEYAVGDFIYEISMNMLFHKPKNYGGDFLKSYLDFDDIEKLRQATKIEPKKYYLKHRFLYKTSGHNFLNYSEYDDTILSTKTHYDNIKTQFTLKEIEEIKEKYNTDLKDFYLIEVEDE